MTESQQTPELTELFAHMDDSLRTILNSIVKEFCEFNKLDLETVNALTELKQDDVQAFCAFSEIPLVPGFLEKLTTPFAIARYCTLYLEAQSLVENVTADITHLVGSAALDWSVPLDFSNTISFYNTPEINSDEPPQSLTVKYRLNADSREIEYYLGTGNWGWTISRAQLKALVTRSAMPAMPAASTAPAQTGPISFSSAMSENEMTVNANGLQIIIKKQ